MDDITLEEGVVVGIRGKNATVRLSKASVCAHCRAGCVERDGYMTAEAENVAGARIGDTVHLKFNPGTALTAILVVFGIPLLALLLGAILGTVVADQAGYQHRSEILGVVAGVTMFFLSFIPVRAYEGRLRKTGSCSIAVVEIMKKGAGMEDTIL